MSVRCVVCGNKAFSDYCFQHKSWKVLKSYPPFPKRTALNKRGPVTKKWMATRTKWLEHNKAPYYFCHYCNKSMTRSQLTLDHKQPRSLYPELRNKLDNLVPCCFSCNTLKGSSPHDEYVHICH